MKKILSILLVLVMIIALIPVAFAAEGDKYTVTFNSDGGSDVPSQSVLHGKYATKPADPSKENYTFSYWENSDGNAFDFSTPITSSITLTAVWATPVTVTFNSNGGTDVASKTVAQGTAVSKPADPTKTGYRFVSWCIANGTEYDFSSVVTDDLILHARWQETKVVTFDMQGHGIAPYDQTVDVGSKATRPATDPTADGYTFGGWYQEDKCTSIFDFDTAITVNTTVYAKWTVNNYTVSFNMNGHGAAIDSQTVEYNKTAIKPEDPKADGYKFGGWYKDAECTTIFDFTTPITANTTVYAKWSKLFTVTFMSNDSVYTTQSVASGSPATKPADPTAPSGYAFGGWYDDSGCTTAHEFSSAITKDTYLYAKWNKLYTITFMSNGSTYTTEKVASGSTATRPEDPTYVGYTLEGWYTDSALTTLFKFTTPITSDMKLYAKWGVSNHTVTMGKYYGENLGRAYYSYDNVNWTEVTSTMSISVANNTKLYFRLDPYSGYYRHPYIVNANGSYYSPSVYNGKFEVVINENKTVKLGFSKSVPTGDTSMWQYVVVALASSGTATGIVAYTKSKIRKK